MFWKKKKKNTYKCSQCGALHDNWPALGYDAPLHYHGLNEEEKERICDKNDDFCIIYNEAQTDRFIRTVLVIPVNDSELDLEYGLWVSLSEKSYDDYSENYYSQDHEAIYFGWVCNNIPDYGNCLQIPTDVITKTGGIRPELRPHNDFDHPLVTDFYNGISRTEAERRIHEMMKALKT